MKRTITSGIAISRICRYQCVLAILALSLMGCHDLSTEPDENTINGYTDLINYLQKAGLTVEPEGAADPLLPCILSEKTFEMTVNGGRIQVFEFKDKEAADAQAERISPNGTSIINSETACSVLFVDTPHFFEKNNLIVLYVGNNTLVINALIERYGVPFAGG